jgi:hypothetical protein
MSQIPGTPVVYTYGAQTFNVIESTPGDPTTAVAVNSSGQVVGGVAGEVEAGYVGIPVGGVGAVAYWFADGDGGLDGSQFNIWNGVPGGALLPEQQVTGHPALPVYFNADGVLSYGPPSPTTTDYSQANLSSLLTNVLDPTDLTHILNHFSNGAVVETDTNGPYNPLPDVTDASGNQPNLLLLDTAGNLVNFDNFPSVHNVVQENADLLNHLILDGSGENEHLYLQAGGQNSIDDNMSNNKLTLLDTGNSGVTLNVDATNQTVVAKTGNNIIKINGDSSDITLKAAGGYNSIAINGDVSSATANGGHSNIGIGTVENNMTLHIGGGNNIVGVGIAQQSLNITGISSTDIINFTGNQTFPDATITKTTDTAGDKITEISFVGQSGITTLNGWHDAVTFAGDPSIHYI